MNRLSFLAVLALVFPGHAFAKGMAIKDLSVLAADTARLSPGSWEAAQEPDRATFICLDCPGAPVIDILTGRQDDGTVARVQSGETTFDAWENLCQTRDPACTLQALDLGPAVGWMTSDAAGSQSAHTPVSAYASQCTRLSSYAMVT